MKKDGAFRADILTFASDHYGTTEEHLWMRFPNYATLRHPNGKWYGIIMDIAQNKLGLPSNQPVDILVTKCDSALCTVLLQQDGFLPAYHLSRKNWITLLLDGTIPKQLAYDVLSQSYEKTETRTSSRR